MLFLDAPSGLAGDMIIAALVDLGVPSDVVAERRRRCRSRGFHVHFGARVRSGIVGDVLRRPRRRQAARAHLRRDPSDARRRRLAEGGPRSRARHVPPPRRGRRRRCIACRSTTCTSTRSARRRHRRHRRRAAALEYLGAELVVSPLPMGHGRVKAASRHPPAPRARDRRVPARARRPTTPASRSSSSRRPAPPSSRRTPRGSRAGRRSSPERIGWGAGTAELADRPNLLRAVLGAIPTRPRPPRRHRPPARTSCSRRTSTTPPANCLQCASRRSSPPGALDAWASPITMKKGRPGLPPRRPRAGRARRPRSPRPCSARARRSASAASRSRASSARAASSQVETPFGRIPVKIAEGPYGPPQRKPEFDACRRGRARPRRPGARGHGGRPDRERPTPRGSLVLARRTAKLVDPRLLAQRGAVAAVVVRRDHDAACAVAFGDAGKKISVRRRAMQQVTADAAGMTMPSFSFLEFPERASPEPCRRRSSTSMRPRLPADPRSSSCTCRAPHHCNVETTAELVAERSAAG